MKLPQIILGLVLATAVVACEESSSIGESILQDEVEIVIDSTFTVTGTSLLNTRVQSRTTRQMLGLIDAKGYGRLESDIVTQFMPSAHLDTAGVTVDDIDSIKLEMKIYNGNYTGDSIVPMGLKVYKLNKQLPSPIYSDFDPASYYSKSDLVASTVYTASALGQPDSVANLSYRLISVALPLQMGRDFFSRYKSNPETFNSPEAFAQWFPGFYIANTYGSGRVMDFTSTNMRMYYHKNTKYNDRDTTYYYDMSYFSVTPEVVSNNNIRFDMSNELKARAQNGETLIVAPTGMDVEITFPGKEIAEKYRADKNSVSVINSLTFEIPAEAIANDYGIDPPTRLLMVLSSEKEDFFRDSKINDNKTSFLATYDKTSGKYSFSGMRNYILSLLEKSQIEDKDVKFTITPVNVTTETSGNYYQSSEYVTGIDPYVNKPAMVKLLLDKAKIKFTYSRQSIKF